MKMNYIWIPIWIFIFLIGLKMNCVDVLGNKGIDIIQKEYYRFFSGNISTLVIHFISFLVAVVLGYIGVVLKIF